MSLERHESRARFIMLSGGPPHADTIPRKMNVHLLKNSPHMRGILSSKAVGEPPLLLSVSALSAVQVWSITNVSLFKGDTVTAILHACTPVCHFFIVSL